MIDQSEFTTNIPQPLALVIFTNRFATLVEEGFSFVQTLQLLEDSPEPYGSDAKRLREEVQAGETASDAMLGRRDLYSSYHIAMIRAGEIGGILDITLRIAADTIAKEWRLMSRCHGLEVPLLIAAPSTKHAPESWEALSPYQRIANQYLLCETWGQMMSAGAHILRCIEVAANLLPLKQRDRMMEAKVDIAAGKRLDAGRLGMLPAFVVAMIDNGEQDGRLDFALTKASEALLVELDAMATKEDI